MNFYPIPLKMNALMEGQKIAENVELRTSIHQNISLMLKSLTLKYRFDPTYGCVLNKFHAKTPPQDKPERLWRESIRESIQKNLKDLLIRYEGRVKVRDVIVDLQRAKRRSGEDYMIVKVQISGELTLGRREKFTYPDSEVHEEAQEVFPLMIPVGSR